MSSSSQAQPAGWYYAQGDPPGTQRYWNGAAWEGEPMPVGHSAQVSEDSLASPGSRMGARLIDWIVWLVFIVIGQVVFINWGAIFDVMSSEVVDEAALEDAAGSGIIAGLFSLALITAYETILVGARGATLGKMAVGTKVVNLDGSKVSYLTALIRIAPYAVLSFLVIVVPVIGSLAQLVILGLGIAGLVLLYTDDKRRTLWDRLAKTLVE